MGEALLWVVLVAAGAAGVASQYVVRIRWVTWVTTRAGAVSFLAAGFVGAGGWIGDLTGWAVRQLVALAEWAGASALGTSSAAWLLWLALAIMWSLALLPDSWVRVQLVDWLSVSGLVLPSLLAASPMGLSEWLLGVWGALADAAVGVASGAA